MLKVFYEDICGNEKAIDATDHIFIYGDKIAFAYAPRQQWSVCVYGTYGSGKHGRGYKAFKPDRNGEILMPGEGLKIYT